jgi:hypothetical protein
MASTIRAMPTVRVSVVSIIVMTINPDTMPCSSYVACRGMRSKIRFSLMRHNRPRPSLRILLVSMTRWSAFRVPQILNR